MSADGGAGRPATLSAAVRDERTASVPAWLIASAAVVGVLGLALRVWVLGRNPVTSDQAVVGLMAREILNGHLFAFYWGQRYGGGEPYVVAALFALFGQSRFVLGLAPLVLDAAAVLLVWRIGRRLFGAPAGVLAAVVFWIWPEDYLYLSTVEYGFRYLTLVCGLAVLLFVLRATEPGGSRICDWALLGLFLGLGWWCSPEIVYFALPAAALLAHRVVRRGLRPSWAAIACCASAALLGALPWVVGTANRSSLPAQHFAAFTPDTWLRHLTVFFEYVLPMVLGLRLRGSGAWLVPVWLGVALYVVVAGLVVASLMSLVLRKHARVLVLFVALFPLLYALSPYSSYWIDGRYAVYLAPVLTLVLAGALCVVARGPSPAFRIAPALGLLAALALTFGAAIQVAPYTPLAVAGTPRSAWTTWRSDPDLWQQPLIAALGRSQTRYVYAGYWIAYSLTFAAHGAVVASDPGDYRYAPYLAQIEKSATPAWVFARATAGPSLDAAAGHHSWQVGRMWTAADFTSLLRSRGIAYRQEEAGYFTIVYPDRSLAASTVLRPPPAR